MELPIELKTAVENVINGLKKGDLMKNAENISNRYRNESGEGKRLLTEDDEAAAYSVVRMPATYGAVFTALNYTLDNAEGCKINSLLDIGAGTGAATWACDTLIDLESVTCLERESAMRNIGKAIMSEGSEVLQNADWKEFDLIKGDINERADLVTVSYVLNELSEEERIKAAEKIWNAADKIALFVEPGTPVGYNNLKRIREHLLAKGAHVVAPCPHEEKCALKGDDWCHFSCRIPRSRLHRQLKNADVPYEDEKFAYLAVSKEEYSRAEMRVLRHPITAKGRITLDICSKNGIETMDVFKREKDLYKKARKADWGDNITRE